MRFKPARYLLRLDDLCPTMSREAWERFEAIINRYALRPILAVIPDNQDPYLNVDEPDPQFWNRMRGLESAGATIAMHGYQHLCASNGESILGLHGKTEFAGIAIETQRKWIREGLAILRGHGLNPRIFVAPRHGFDGATLTALAAEGLRVLSDGFATRPFTREGILWIPQQLWEPVTKSKGLWTICIHPNTAPAALEATLDAFLHRTAPQFVSLDDILSECEPSGLGWMERLEAWVTTQRVRFSSSR